MTPKVVSKETIVQFTTLLALLAPLAEPAKEIVIREGAALIAKIYHNSQPLTEEEWATLHQIRDRAEREHRDAQKEG